MVSKKAKSVFVVPLVFGLFIAVCLMVFVFADLNRSPITMSVNQTISNVYNITIINNDTTVGVNFTNINITLPANFSFVSLSNGSNITYALANFTNTSSILSWNNFTLTALVNGTAAGVRSAVFYFNATVSTPGTYNITITTFDTGSQTNTTNITVTVNDTVAPNVTFVSPVSSANISGSAYVVNATINDSYSPISISKGSCV